MDLELSSAATARFEAVGELPVVAVVEIEGDQTKNELSGNHFCVESFPSSVFKGRVPSLGQVFIADDLASMSSNFAYFVTDARTK